MRRAAVVGLLLFAADTRAGAQPQPPLTANQVVANVQAAYAGVTTYSADFSESYLAKAYNRTKTSAGHVVFRQGGKMDWKYTNPPGTRVVSDGTTVCVYDAANKVLSWQTVAQSQFPAVQPFFTGGAPVQMFSFSLLKGEYPSGDVLVGTPSVPTPAYTKALFYVDVRSWDIERVLVLDSQQNRSRFDFTNVRRNVAARASQFVIYPPPGTTFIGAPPLARARQTCP